MADNSREMEDWTGAVGDRWLANIDRFEGMLAGLHARIAEKIALQPGETALDVGCGGGPLAIMLARSAGPQGQVTGLDVAPQLIDLARQRQSSLGLTNLTFEVGNAEEASVPGAPFDRLVSAFGVMFFEDSLAAFTHLHSLCREGARLDMACWAAPDRNPWMGTVMGVIGSHAELPERNLDEPGPFRFANPEKVIEMLGRAGFSQIGVEEVEQDQPLGGAGASVDEAIDFVLTGLDMDALLSEQGVSRDAVVEDLRAALSPFARPEGVMLPATALFYSGVA